MKNKSLITSIAIGKFDGMHLAHQTLLSNLSKNGAVVVIETGYENLTPRNDRDKYTTYPIYYYDLKHIKELDALAFIELLKEEFPNLRKIVVGFDFCFGKDRKYNALQLKELFDKEVIIVNEISINDIAVHSNEIREFIVNGDLKTAATLLGRKYKIKGLQIRGQGLGQKEFVPTINLEVSNYLLPQEGVYITRAYIYDKIYNSITFIGNRATTDGTFSVETHLLTDEKVEECRKKISIKFIKKLRDNQKFDSFALLKEQIIKDIEVVQNYFNIN